MLIYLVCSLFIAHFKKRILNKKFIENSYTVRIIASNIDLKRFYDDTSAEEVINELILISKPEKTKRIFFMARGIIPNTYLDQIQLYKNEFSYDFNENHLIGLGVTRGRLKIIKKYILIHFQF